jgi:hypothetical protein
MVNLFIGNTAADLPKDTVIALTLQVHDLTNLESRNGNFTNNIKLPLTNLNKGLLGFPHDVNSQSSIPYSRIEAQMQIDGVTISGFLQVNSATQFEADCVFFSGNSDFFDLLGDKKLNDLDLAEFDSYWNIDGLTPNTFSTKTNTTGVIWPIIEYGTDEVYRTLTNAFTVNPKTLRPAIFMHSLMNKIAELTGYAFTGDFLADNRYLKEFVPIVTNDPKHSDGWNALQVFDGTLNTPQITHLDPSQTAIVTYSLDDTTDPGLNYTSYYYRCPATGKYSLKLSVDLLNTTGRPVSALIELIYRDNSINNVTILTSITVNLPDVSTDILIQTNVQCAQGNDLYPLITFTNLSGVDDEDVESNIVFEVYDINDTIIGYTNLFECTGNMPEMSLKEFVKSLVQRYNLILITDVVAQIAQFVTYDEVYNAEPLDWTDKLNVSNHSIAFHPDFFGQNNQFRWADETNNPPDYANGNIEIGDTTLKKELITIQQPFAASLDVIRFDNQNVMQIPLLEFDEQTVNAGDSPAIAEPSQLVISNVTNYAPGFGIDFSTTTNIIYKLETVKPRIGYIDNTLMTEELVYDDGTTTAQNSTTEPLTHFWNNSAYNLTFTANSDGLIDNYTTLTFSLDKFKKLKALFNLKATDALGFDFKRRIFIQHLGTFYVNKISNYQPGKLTEVELIKT